MKFTETSIAGVLVIEVDELADERGSFSRTFCAREFAEARLPERWVQSSLSYNRWKGTVRGMHYQRHPAPETKIVRCTRGAIFDVAVDLRTDSSTYGRWVGIELSATNRRSILIPPGCAHGFQTMEDDSDVLYMMDEFYVPELSGGVLWNDSALAIDWPEPVTHMSERDASLPSISELSP